MSAHWDWISDSTNQKTLAFIGSGVAAVAAAVWKVCVHWKKKKEPPPSSQISASSGGIAAGGNVTATAQPGGTAVIATGGVVNIGITLEQHHEFLKRREEELRAKFATKASPEEKAVLEKQLGVMEQQLANLNRGSALPCCYFDFLSKGTMRLLWAYSKSIIMLCAPRLDAPGVLHHVMAPWDHAADHFSR